jgi:hypothetical protein
MRTRATSPASRLLVTKAVLTLTVLTLPQPALAGGLKCSIGEVVIENLKIGQKYSLKTLANLPLTLTNTSDHPVRVAIDAMIPDASELRQGAEAIPSADWASAMPETLELASKETQAAELMLEIPDDESLFGRRFQAVFWSHTLPRAGEMLAYGLKSRVIFTVDTTRENEGVTPTGDLSLSLVPSQAELERLTPGRKYRLEEALHEPLKVRNTSDRQVQVEIRALSLGEAGLRPEAGCADLLEAGELSITPSTFALAPGEERTVKGVLSLSKRDRPKGKVLMCVVAAAVTDREVKTQIYSRIYAHHR